MIQYNIEDRSEEISLRHLQKLKLSSIIKDRIERGELYSNGSKLFTIEGTDIPGAITQLRDKLNASVMQFNNRVVILPDEEDFIINCWFSSRSNYVTIRTQGYFNSETSSFQDLISYIVGPLDDHIMDAEFVDFTWAFKTKNGTNYGYFSDPITEVFHKECYPYISDFEGYCGDFMDSDSAALILKGRPGTGKTRFIRYLLREHSKNTTDKQQVLYVSNKDTLTQEDIFVSFLNDDYSFMVIEDADEALKSRKSGNSVMTNILTASDGIISNISKKVIITTNLPNINDIDDALIRPGRCYDRIEFSFLDNQEADDAISAISGGEVDAIPEDYREDKYVLADVYEIYNDVI